jgi:hypothetical protein
MTNAILVLAGCSSLVDDRILLYGNKTVIFE